MVIGIWSEESCVWVDHSAEMARLEVAREMSGEEGEPVVGSLVWDLSLRTQKSEVAISSARASPLGSEKGENQRGL